VWTILIFPKYFFQCSNVQPKIVEMTDSTTRNYNNYTSTSKPDQQVYKQVSFFLKTSDRGGIITLNSVWQTKSKKSVDISCRREFTVIERRGIFSSYPRCIACHGINILKNMYFLCSLFSGFLLLFIIIIIILFRGRMLKVYFHRVLYFAIIVIRAKKEKNANNLDRTIKQYSESRDQWITF